MPEIEIGVNQTTDPETKVGDCNKALVTLWPREGCERLAVCVAAVVPWDGHLFLLRFVELSYAMQSRR